MDIDSIRMALRGSAVPLLSLLAIIAGFGLLRLSALAESYLLMTFAFVLMVGGIVVVAFREKAIPDDWSDH